MKKQACCEKCRHTTEEKTLFERIYPDMDGTCGYPPCVCHAKPGPMKNILFYFCVTFTVLSLVLAGIVAYYPVPRAIVALTGEVIWACRNSPTVVVTEESFPLGGMSLWSAYGCTDPDFSHTRMEPYSNNVFSINEYTIESQKGFFATIKSLKDQEESSVSFDRWLKRGLDKPYRWWNSTSTEANQIQHATSAPRYLIERPCSVEEYRKMNEDLKALGRPPFDGECTMTEYEK